MNRLWWVGAADRLMRLSKAPAPQTTEALAALLVVWVTWLWANPYQGIWHDARVYLVMAYRHLAPEAFARDVWFMFGAQDRSSLFDELYAGLLAVSPVDVAAKAVALVGGMVWAVGAVWLARVTIGPRWGLWAAVLLCVLAPPYTFIASKIFVLTESFATARPYAMGLTLAGMAAYVQGGRLIAVAALSAGIALHPLMASWGVLAVLGLAMPDRSIAAALLVGLVVVIGAAALGLEPLQPMDAAWFQLVQSTSAIVLAPSVEALALDQNLWWLAILLIAGRLGTETYRRLYLLVGCLAAWGLFASVVLSFHFPAAWPVQAQPWRALWLAVAVGIIAAVDVCRQSRRSAYPWLWPAVLLGSYLLAGQAWGGVLLLITWALHVCPKIGEIPAKVWGDLSLPSRKVVVTAGAVWLLLVTFFAVFSHDTYQHWILPGITRSIEVPTMLTTLVVPLLMVWGVSRLNGWIKIWGVVALVLISGVLWDQRPSALRLVESRYDPAGQNASLRGSYQRGDVVYWPDSDLGPWLELATAGYAQNVQAIGIVFSRDHAVLLQTRLHRIRGLQPPTPWDQAFQTDDLHAPYYYPARWDGRALRSLCLDPDLDLVVLSSPARGLDAHVTVQRPGAGVLQMYRCATLRNRASAGANQGEALD
ncbi:hypothetical protein [Caldimonas manganoxidans]|uniref:hypothetical protein n=1 Tax=Caldimonas manganoxidans TaxID=196015 RepID=UPI00052706BF|nr:hypothetical protein [Caldimonas manganoxidans]